MGAIILFVGVILIVYVVRWILNFQHEEESTNHIKDQQRLKNTNNTPHTHQTSKKILFFDTETTGLPVDYNAPTSDTMNWPHMVQLSWIITDDYGNELKAENFIIQPCRWRIPLEATRIHGISQEHAMAVGIPIQKVLEKFMTDFDEAALVVCHNTSFDKAIVGCELERLHIHDRIAEKPEYDTMTETTDFCRLKWSQYYGSYKWPKLQELYYILFGRNFDSAHDASNDARATMECFWELVRIGEIRMFH